MCPLRGTQGSRTNKDYAHFVVLLTDYFMPERTNHSEPGNFLFGKIDGKLLVA